MLPSAKKIQNFSILVYSDSTAANDNWHCEHRFWNDFEYFGFFIFKTFNFFFVFAKIQFQIIKNDLVLEI